MTRRAKWSGDAAVVALLVAVAFWTGRFAFGNAAVAPLFYQAAFGPAVMIAAGAGFVNPEPDMGSPLQRFLGMRVDAIEFADARAQKILEPDQFQHAHRYLLTAVGYWWGVAGISWSQLGNVAAVIHVLAVLSVFALLRLFVPVSAAALGALWFGTTPLQMAYVSQFRDYSKGAFILATFPLIVLMVFGAATRKRLIGVAAATGFVIGLGFGFKMDAAIMLPIAAVAVVLFRDRRPWTGLVDKALCLAVVALAFVITAGPILFRLTSGGSNVAHVFLLGSGEWFDSALRINPAPYRPFPYYSDDYMVETIRTRAEAESGQSIVMPSPEYERAGVALWTRMLRLMPADAAARMLASADSILNLGSSNRDPMAVRSEFPVHHLLRPVYNWLERFRDDGAWLGVIFVLAVSARSLRHGAFAAVLLLLLASYPSLQFDARHFFYLQAIPIALVVVLLTASGTALASWIRARRLPDVRWRAGALRLATAALMLIAMVVAPVTALRAYQARNVTAAIDGWLQAPGVRLVATFDDLGDGRWLARWPDAQGQFTTRREFAAAYYMVEFETRDARTPIAMAIRHTPPLSGCPRVLTMSTGPGISRLAFPVYSQTLGPVFDGLEFGTDVRQHIKGIYRLSAGPDTLPIEWRLPADWRNGRLHQSLAIERDERPFSVQIAAADQPCEAPLRYVDAVADAVMTPVAASVDRLFSPAASIGANGLVMDGPADQAYVMQFKPLALNAGDALVASVDVREGGTTLGVLRDGAWTHYITLDGPGEAVVVVPVAAAGVYLPMAANAHPGGNSRFTIRRLGIVTSDGRRVGLAQDLPAGGSEAK